jgi:hypothetical protein
MSFLGKDIGAQVHVIGKGRNERCVPLATVVIYDLDLATVEAACSDFYKVFSIADAPLLEERYNLPRRHFAPKCRAICA